MIPFHALSRRQLCLAAFAAMSLATGAASAQQAFPNRPIRIVIGFGTGGQADILARLLAQKLAAQLKQAVIVDNKPGAGGNIATEMVAKAPPDGHTLLLVASSLSVNPSLFKNVGYDPVKDLAPVISLATYPLYLVAPVSGARSVAELIVQAKAKPGAINYSSSGQGTSTHIAPEMFAAAAGVKLTHVPYKGGGHAVMAVTAGETQLHFGGSAVLPLVKSGKLQLLAVTTRKRHAGFPDVPTVGESVPGFEFSSWNGLFAPAGTPPAIVQRLNAEVAKALRQSDSVETLRTLDLDPALGSPEELGALVKTEAARWPKVIRDLGITAD
ncbi:MAG TPA: tripartite tricarboxylate transporter substrate binding protein [Ramlibacter sp.]|nr:tripartite tricarboxylate transporter substrate binding protein [Ramlibacter sp.]